MINENLCNKKLKKDKKYVIIFVSESYLTLNKFTKKCKSTTKKMENLGVEK